MAPERERGRQKQMATNPDQNRRTTTGETKAGVKVKKEPSRKQLRHNITTKDGYRKTRKQYKDI